METTEIAGAGKGPVRVEPDLDFIRNLSGQVDGSFKKCFQCGTCSATCDLSPDDAPFPRKEMAWAAWGLRDRLLEDIDVWLCWQCDDCSTRCPRCGRPGDVLAAVRRESIIHHSPPRFLGRWVSRPQFIPLLLGIAAMLLGVALALRIPLEKALGIEETAGDRILFSYSRGLPHWLLDGLFGILTVVVIAVFAVGVARFWRTLRKGTPRSRPPAKSIRESILAALRKAVAHDTFSRCTARASRRVSHLCVFFGFLALTAVTIWVILAPLNPLARGPFVYPFDFWSPWKLLANLGGVALVTGCLLMIRDRLTVREEETAGTYFDWSLIGLLLLVAVSGFVTEILHYARFEPHRHAAYFLHLMLALSLLMYLPYSKLAHVVYRTTALVLAERVGRTVAPPKEATPSEEPVEAIGG